MARNVRIQYAGAIYHVMSRGNRREPIFRDDKDREMFLATLVEMCGRTGMAIHSYVLMSNHYHLLLETPEPNLVAGMKWFQGTFTQRTNARHRLVGHLFQGRYKAIPVESESGDYFQTVSDYIHLNPVRAGLLKEGDLLEYRWSSFPALVEKGVLPRWLKRGRLFGNLGLPDEGAGSRRRYGALMQARTNELFKRIESEEESERWKELRRGWYLGSEKFRDKMEDLADAILKGHRRRSYRRDGLQGHDEKEARGLLEWGLERVGMSLEELILAKKNDVRKQALAWLIKSRTVVGDAWLIEHLGMGDRSNVSRAVQAYRAPGDGERGKLMKKLQQCTD